MNMKDLIDSVPSATTNDGDFSEDGLLHCGNCRAPKETKISFPWGEQTVRVMCECEEEAFNRRIEEEKQRHREEYIRLLRETGLPYGLRTATFANDNGSNPELTERAKRYADKWDEIREKNIGLLFWGGTGNGKTYTAACVANALIDKGIPAIVTSFSTILGKGIDEREDYIQNLNRYDLLVLDDLGTERNTPFAMEVVYRVIDDRYTSEKPMIVTTNLTLDQMKKPDAVGVEYQRIYDRVLGMCIPLHFKQGSVRGKIADEKLEAAREILGGGA